MAKLEVQKVKNLNINSVCLKILTSTLRKLFSVSAVYAYFDYAIKQKAQQRCDFFVAQKRNC